MRVALEDLRDCLGLTDRILLPGRVSNPEAALKQADLFVLPSRFEGFPMALCEAMAAGLPVIAADCPTGPREIIRPDVDGILIPPEDPAALAAALARLMDDDALRHRLGGRAAEVVDRFSVDRIMAMWEAIVADALAEVSLR